LSIDSATIIIEYMDYTQYSNLEFRRKFFKLFGASITIYESASNTAVGFITMKAFRLRSDIRVFRDSAQQQELIRIGGKKMISFKPTYDVFDSQTSQQLITIRFKSLRSYLYRVHVDLLDDQGNIYGYVQETSSWLAITRRWFGLLPFGDFIELIFAFIPQTFTVMYAPNGQNPQSAAYITHRKNPAIVKMSLDTTRTQTKIDPRINIAICTILSILDANKNA
jgi:hypothetical protein